MKLTNFLLVEDDEIDVMALKRAFKNNHIQNKLDIASDGVQALDMLYGRNNVPQVCPDLILLDINMPKMNGLELLKTIRSDSKLKSLSVIVLTTSDNEKDKMEAYNLNVAGYILKPVQVDSFIGIMAIINKYWMLCEFPCNS